MGRNFWKLKAIWTTLAVIFSVNSFSQVENFSNEGSIGISESYIIADTGYQITEYNFMNHEYLESYKPLLQFSEIVPGIHYWVKFKVFNTTDFNFWLMEMRPKLKIADLYIPMPDGEFTRMSAGLNTSYSKWPYPYKNILFPVRHNAEDEFYYIHVYSDYSVGLGLLAERVDSVFKRVVPEYTWHGMFFGIIGVATLFSLIFYFKLKERAYLFYALYVTSFATFAFVDWGMVVKTLTYIHLPWHRDLYTIPFSGMTVFLLLYIRKVLETGRYDRLLDRMIVIAVISRLFIYLVGTIFNLSHWYSPSVDNIILLVGYVAAFRSYRRGYQPSRYVIIGLSVLYLGLIIHSLENIGLVPYNVLPAFSMYKMGVIEMVFFSIALADRFRILKEKQEEAHIQTIRYLEENTNLQEKVIRQLNENERLKDSINRELEQKVLERTKELEEANSVIVEINHFLEDSNRKLASDVRKISLNRVMQKTVTFEEFKEIYPDEDSCYVFLDRLKWAKGFSCKKCGYEKYSPGNTPYSRRCSRCNYIERITSYTIFSNIKFPVTKAFYMLFLVNTGKNFTIDKLGDMLDLRKQTVWYFKKKILGAMQNKRTKSTMEEGWSRWILDRQN